MSTLEDAMRQFLAANPNLPAGEDPVDTAPAKPRAKDKLVITIERKGRGGKTATIVSGFTIDDTEIASVARDIKTRLGVGGSCRGGEILIQGEHRDEVAALLRAKGFRI